MKGAEIIVDSLIKEGVDTIFGYPGGTVIPIFDVLYSTPGIKFILSRHEQGATHAADGYARATGKVGVVIVTSGPGATNTITGIATAKLDSIPIVVISGQVKTANIGTDAFQETDMSGLTRTICKHNFLIKNIYELPRVLKEAFFIARSGRPGPVSVDIPLDVEMEELENYSYPQVVELPGYKPVFNGNPKQIGKLLQAMKAAKKPLIYSGGGIISSGASEALCRFVEKTQIPIVTTLMGLGSIPFDHPQFLGMPGMHGSVAANYALSECDFLITIGARFDDRITGNPSKFATKAKVAHIDIDPAEIGKSINADIPVVGDAKSTLDALIKRAPEGKRTPWNERVDGWKEKYKLNYNQAESDEILPQHVIKRVSQLVDNDVIISTDVGQNQMWAAQYFNFRKPRSLLTSGGLGTMGYGLPAAMGAAIGRPECRVINFSGDGGIQMNIQELTTCAINKIPVKIVVLNNAYLGMVRQWQDLFWNKRYSGTCLMQGPECPRECDGPSDKCPTKSYLPDLVKVAEANGVPGFRATRPDEVDQVIRQGLQTEGPVLMEFMVKREENVFPMVPAGKPLDQIILGDKR